LSVTRKPVAKTIVSTSWSTSGLAGSLGQGDHHQLARSVDQLADEPLRRGEAPVERPLEAGHRPIRVGEDPGRSALQHREVLHLGLDLRNDLDGRRARADDGHPLAAEIVAVVPPGGVEVVAGEVVEAGQRGDRGLAEAAVGADQDIGADGARRRLDDPRPGVLLPGGRNHLAVGAEVAAEVEVVGGPTQVRLDLGLGGVGAAPVRVLGEGEGVEVGRHVALAAGIGVVPPGAADVVAPLEEDEVVDAVLLEAMGQAEAGEPGADDGHSDVICHVD
jgi:hypothetical protein